MGCTASLDTTSKIRRPSMVSRITEKSNVSKSDLRPHLDSPHLLDNFQSDSCINCLIISDDLSMMLTGDDDGELTVWSALSDPVEQLITLSGHKAAITALQMTDDFIVSGSDDGVMIQWSIGAMEPLAAFSGHKSKINNIICASNIIFSSSYDRTAKAWNLDTRILQMNVSSEDENGLIPSRCSCIRTFEGHEKSVYPMVFIPTGGNWIRTNSNTCSTDVLVTGSADTTVRIWSLALGDCLKVLTGHCAPVHCLAVDEMCPQRLFSAGGDGVIICWDTITGDRLRNLYGHEGTVLAMVTHHKMLFSGSTDKTARSWVSEFGEETRVFKGSHSAVTRVQFFDGMVYTGSEDGTCRVFDAKSGTMKRSFKGPGHSVTGLENVPGKLLVSHSDGSVCVWDTKGITEETVFGTKELEVQEVSDDDDSTVQEAIAVLEKYIVNH